MSNYISKGHLSLPDFIGVFEGVSFENRRERKKVTILDEKVNAKSLRYELFLKKGFDCICCGIKGTHFSLERFNDQTSYHLNLYANDVMMTKDHRLPKSKGGKDDIDNLQPMCSTCNELKGNNYESV
jgi:5-methylcytosine-specific restriction endonuclease McrA